jgi:hypothetical protein
MTLGRPLVSPGFAGAGRAAPGVTPGALSGVEPIETCLYHGDLFINLTDRQAEVVARSPLEVDGQLLTMRPEIVEGPSVA